MTDMDRYELVLALWWIGRRWFSLAALLGPAVAWFWQWKGLGFWRGLVASFLFSPFIAFLVGLSRKANQQVREQRRLAQGYKKCAHCAELIRREATT